MEPATINTLLALLPNLAIAIWCIYRQQKTIDALLIHQQALIDQLMLMCAKAPPLPCP